MLEYAPDLNSDFLPRFEAAQTKLAEVLKEFQELHCGLNVYIGFEKHFIQPHDITKAHPVLIIGSQPIEEIIDEPEELEDEDELEDESLEDPDNIIREEADDVIRSEARVMALIDLLVEKGVIDWKEWENRTLCMISQIDQLMTKGPNDELDEEPSE